MKLKSLLCLVQIALIALFGLADPGRAGESTAEKIEPPAAFGEVPTLRQLAWHEMELYNMIEFSPITYLDNVDWGWGNEDPSLLNPVDFNAEAIVRVAKEAGFKGFLVQAKHHGGFCMWPTKTTSYNISASPWRDGKGDWIREWTDACRKHGLKVGVYCCPWDRSTDKFGTRDYIEMYKEQLRELMTDYGEQFIVWFDGAPGAGGDGYYGGKGGRRVCKYPWDEIFPLVRELQPNAVIFSDVGPDVRWVGNEKGIAGDPCWSTIDLVGLKGREPAPGSVDARLLNVGTRFGSKWIAPECDFPLRRRFTYHAEDAHTVKTPLELFDKYVQSVGRGGCMDLALQINRLGTLDKNDEDSLRGFGDLVRKTFAHDLAQGARLIPSNVRGGSDGQFGANHLLDGDRYSYWATDDNVTTAELVVELCKDFTFNIVRLRENIKLGQRLDSVSVEIWDGGGWRRLAQATSIGACRLIRLKEYVTTSRIRLKLESPVCPALSEFSLFAEPHNIEKPEITRNKNGIVTLKTEGMAYQVRYTIDGSAPSIMSTLYEKPFEFERQGVVRAAAFSSGGRRGDVSSREFDISKKIWKIHDFSAAGRSDHPASAIDDTDLTWWESGITGRKPAQAPQFLAVDMGQIEEVAAFTYDPKKNNSSGVVDRYEFHVSHDGEEWEKVAEGEFDNIRNSPVTNVISLPKAVACRYFKFVATRVLEGDIVTAAELGVRRR